MIAERDAIRIARKQRSDYNTIMTGAKALANVGKSMKMIFGSDPSKLSSEIVSHPSFIKYQESDDGSN